MFSVNFNDYVKVKLTDQGMSILKQERVRLNKHIQERGGKGFGEYEPKLDEQGYASFQIWDLIGRFGPHMGLCKPIPFEGKMIFEQKASSDEEPLFSIEIKDMTSIPRVKYKGEEITMKTEVRYHWSTRNEECSGKHELVVEHAEKDQKSFRMIGHKRMFT